MTLPLPFLDPDVVGGKDALDMPQPWFRFHFNVPEGLDEEVMRLGVECMFFQPEDSGASLSL